MSSDDILQRATRALREQTDGASSDAARTRARVLAPARSARRTRFTTLFLPIAAVLALSTAWASAHGGLAGVWQRIEGSSGHAGAPPPVQAIARPVTEAPPAQEPEPAAPAPAPTAADVPIVAVDSLPRATASTSTSAPTPTPTPTSTPTPTPTPPPAQDPAALLYAAAHRAHFVDHDPAAALRAWDAYLLAAPDGAFAPEARYNRAITLVRLGRTSDARRALAPFAGGVYGTYRSREARELLDSLPPE